VKARPTRWRVMSLLASSSRDPAMGRDLDSCQPRHIDRVGDQGASGRTWPHAAKMPILATSTEVVDWMFHWDPRVAYP
jgi:hypothetical protein